MIMGSLEQDLVEVVDLLSFTFSSAFVDKWGFKYGKRLPSLLQMKLLRCLNTKPLKIHLLTKFLVVDSGFGQEVVESFLNDIDYTIYRPIIQGNLQEVQNDE
jgi:hypothetical protein